MGAREFGGIVVQAESGDLLTTTAAIADGTELQHKNVMELVRTYLADLEDFGGVAFQTLPFATTGGMQSREVAMLNEQQATLLITYMRNSDIVRSFKKALVRAFYDAKAAPQFAVPTTLSGALRLAAEQAETIEAQAAQLAIAKPAVAFVESYVTRSTGSLGFRAVAKLIGAKENAFRDFLKGEKIMYQLGGTWHSFAQHLDAGRLEVRAGTTADGIETKGRAFTQTMFTPKGVSWIAGEWAKHQISNRDGSAA